MSYYSNIPDPNQLNADAVFSNYYNQNWYVDSSTSNHLTGDRSILNSGPLNHSGQSISTIECISHPVHGSKSANVPLGFGSIKLQNILYVPALCRNLISVGRLTDQQHVLIFEDNCFFVLDNKYNRKL
jgi:hypothetical protein